MTSARGQNIPFVVVTVADHQSATVLIDLANELLHIRCDIQPQGHRGGP